MTFFPTFMRRAGAFAPPVLTRQLVRAPAVRPEHRRVPWLLSPVVGNSGAQSQDTATYRWEPLTMGAPHEELIYDSNGDAIMQRIKN
jgi:hypothetical protein